MTGAAGLLTSSSYYFNGFAVPFLLAAFLTLFVGGYVLAHGNRRQLLSFAMLSGLIFLWLFTTVLVYSCKYPEAAEVYIRFMYFGISFIPPSLYLYVSVWLNQWQANRIKISVGYLLALSFFVLIFVTKWIVGGVSPFFWGFHSRLTPLGVFLFIPFFFMYVFLFFQTLYRGYRRAEDLQLRRQVRLVSFAFMIAFFATMDFFPCFGMSIFPTGGLILFLAYCVLSYTVIRYKLFDIETAIHKTLMWMMTTAVAIVPFVIVIYGTQRFLADSSVLETTFYFLVLAITFNFYFRALQPRLDQLFQRQRKNLRALLTEFSSELVHLKNLRDLLQSFSRMLRHKLYVRQLSVYLLDEKKKEFVPMIVKGLQRLRSFPASHPFLMWIEENDEVVVGNLIGTNPEVVAFRPAVEDYLAATQAMVVVPFVLGGKLIGLGNLGKKTNLRKYGFREAQFFSQLKSPLTIAFSNSMRYDDIRSMSEELRCWNVELEKRVEDRTRELVRTQEQLIQAEKLATLGTLAGGVAHEINNPLTAVLTNAQILKMSATADMRESLGLIEEGAKRCQIIVQKLMKYARKTAEEAPHKPLDLNEVVKGTCALLGFQFQQENISIEMKLGSLRPISGVANELEQVLTNLLVNARDAILAAKVAGCIKVETRMAQTFAELIVKDNGVGIAKDNIKKIFDPFFTTKDVGSGTGLGLAVSFGILKRHHADLKVDSTPGNGATFTLKFPLADKKE